MTTDQPLALARDEGEGWIAWQGDNVLLMRGMDESSVDLSVCSIPFANLLTYSNSAHDAGNSVDHDQFFEGFKYTCAEWLRVTKPGRIVAVHVMNLPSLKFRDGHIGLIDFRGQTIRAFEAAGFIYAAEVTIRKDPVVAQQRTKALGLLYKTILSNSAMSRMGIPDYVCFFRKPGANVEPIAHTKESFPLPRWQRWAEPVWVEKDFPDGDWRRELDMWRDPDGRPVFLHDAWMDIDQSDTLQARSARENDDERHLAPLQIEVIRRCIQLYSNPRDVVFDPYGGIASTGVVALEENRRSVTCELKGSYYRQAVLNLRAATVASNQPDLFSRFTAPTGATP